jgi:hypothetical protein
VHVDEQPSPLTSLPSSHASGASILPLLQIKAQTEGFESSQVWVASTVQEAEQPSPLATLPSSHASGASI